MAEESRMEDLTLGFITVLLFCLSCRQFIQAVLAPIPIMASQRTQARGALALQKVYVSTAWAVMSAVFFVSMMVSFQQVFITL